MFDYGGSVLKEDWSRLPRDLLVRSEQAGITAPLVAYIVKGTGL